MKHPLIVFAILFVILFSLAFPSTVEADIAPPEPPPGSNLVPGFEQTQVRMVSETVLLDVQSNTPDTSYGQARVSADFTMHNTGNQDETMMVRFPISADDGWGKINEIKDLRVKVGDRLVTVQKTTDKDELLPWAEFSVTFPVNQDVIIHVNYLLEAAATMPYIWFNYIFSTGAGWKDAIGNADMIVRMPYAVEDNLNVSPTSKLESANNPVSRTVTGYEIRWTYTDFEPTENDNFEIKMVAPSVWLQVLDLRATLSQTPDDGEAWGMLGKQYKQLAFDRKLIFMISPDLYQLSRKAYEKAIALKPYDAAWHAGYAELLCFYDTAEQWKYYIAGETNYTHEDALSGLKEIQIALKLDPANSKVQEIANEISWYFPDGLIQNGSIYDFPWLTATPLPPTPTIDYAWWTKTPTRQVPGRNVATPLYAEKTRATAATTPQVFSSPVPVKTQTPNFTPASSASSAASALKWLLPLFGVILVAVFGFLFFRRYRH